MITLSVSVVLHSTPSHTAFQAKHEDLHLAQPVEMVNSSLEDRPDSHIEELIEHYSDVYDANEELAKKVSECESQFRNVPNENGAKYGIGPYQWVRTSFIGMCEGNIWNAEDNVRCGVETISNGDLHHWGYPPGDPRGYDENGDRWGTYDCWIGEV